MIVADFLLLLVQDDEDQVRRTQAVLAKANLVNPLRVVGREDQAIAYLSGRGAYGDRVAHPLPSLVLVDADLSEGGAARVLEWLRNQPTLNAIPVVLLTPSDSDPLELTRSQEAVVTTSVAKPVDLEGLLRMMHGIGMYWMILSPCAAGATERELPRPAAPSVDDRGRRRQDTDILGHRVSFQKTSWDLVRAARNSEALDGLIRIYWKPLYFFVRQKGYDNETSKDIVQDFLTAALEHDMLSKADPGRGRFRTFLLASLTNFIKDWNRASGRLKRGGGRTLRSLDFEGGEQEYSNETASERTPEALFHRAWAQGLLTQCISELKGKPSHLRAFELLMSGSGYPEICKDTGLNESAAKTAVHRLRQQLRRLVLGYIGMSEAGEQELDLALAEFASSLL